MLQQKQSSTYSTRLYRQNRASEKYDEGNENEAQTDEFTVAKKGLRQSHLTIRNQKWFNEDATNMHPT